MRARRPAEERSLDPDGRAPAKRWNFALATPFTSPIVQVFGRSAMSQLSLLSAPERTWIILKIVDVGCP